MSKRGFYLNSLLMSGVVFISRIFGFARDVILAAFFGTSILGDAFFLSFRIPNTLRSLLGEGAFNSAFIPVYSDYLKEDDKNKEGLFLGNIFLRFAFILFIISLLMMLFSDQIIYIISIGMKHKGDFIHLTSNLLKITSWYLLLVGLSAFFMAIQQANNSFARAAAGQIVFNISFIMVLLLLFRVKNDIYKVYIASSGVIVAGLFQAFFQFGEVMRMKRPFFLNIKSEMQNIKKLTKIIMPAVFGQAIIEINLFADSFFALFISTGVVSAMYYASRLMQLPLGIFSVSIATVSLTIFSKKISKNESIKADFERSLNSIATIIIPISSFLIGASIYIINMLFLRGNFTKESADLTNYLLVFYSLGLISYSFVKVFAQVFYAHKLVKFPVLFTSIAMIVNILLNMILIRYMGAGGLALASALSATLNFLFLYYYLEKKFKLNVNFSLPLKLIAVGVISAISMLLLKKTFENLIVINIVFIRNMVLCTVFFIINAAIFFIAFPNLYRKKIMEFKKRKIKKKNND